MRSATNFVSKYYEICHYFLKYLFDTNLLQNAVHIPEGME